jgi:hypothetical protein
MPGVDRFKLSNLWNMAIYQHGELKCQRGMRVDPLKFGNWIPLMLWQDTGALSVELYRSEIVNGDPFSVATEIKEKAESVMRAAKVL